MPGTLYLVATPIGNLEDVTHRAIRVLHEVDLIACEDTRHTQKLLNHFSIQTPTTSYHEHNEKERANQLLAKLLKGSDIAIVSDAGTPAINDPGFRIVRLAIENGVAVVPVPGAVALISALVASGFPTDEFFFGGFLPPKTGQRRARLGELAKLETTLIFYEAPHRIAEALRDALDVLGDREAVVAREITKLHETFTRGRLSELARTFSSDTTRGEIVLLIDRHVIEQPRQEPNELANLVAKLVGEGMDERAALKQAAKKFGLSRDEAYRRLQLSLGKRSG
jgi:16S rRNA (cytidine1402-2'-O)-methyltransferase